MGDSRPMRYVFEDCELDTGVYELRRAGEVLRVEPQVFDVLLHLVRQRAACRGDGGVGVAVAGDVAGMAPAGEVWVTSTVRDLTAGSGLSYRRRGELEVPVLGRFELDVASAV